MSAKAEPKVTEPSACYLDRQPDLEQAKARFIIAAENISPFNIVRQKPLASIGVAFLAGIGLSAFAGSRSGGPALASMTQIAGLVTQLIPLFTARARSSGG